MTGEKTRDKFLKGVGRTGSSRLSMSIDLTDVINFMDFAESVKQAISKEDKLGKRTHEYMVQYAYSAYAAEIVEYSYGKESRMAHVYEWSEVLDESIGVSTKRNNNSVFDRSNIFKPSFDRDKPLWRLDPPRESSGSFVSAVSFFSNNQPAMYDKRVYSASNLQGPKRWGQHHFRDQASQLETVQKIIKRTDRVSRRRIGATRVASGKAGGIVQLTASTGGGTYLQNYQNYTRTNKFYRKFAEFYMSFATQAAAGAQGVIVDSEKDFEKVIRTEAQTILQARSRMVQEGLSGVSVDTSAGVKVRPGGANVRINFTNNGKPIATIPQRKPMYVNQIAGALHRELIDKTARIQTREVRRIMGAPELSKGGKVGYKVGDPGSGNPMQTGVGSPPKPANPLNARWS
jgi:hypothetical protein